MFAKSEDAKKAGWFSRRHKTNEAHLAAKEARERKRDAKRNRERGIYVVPGALNEGKGR